MDKVYKKVSIAIIIIATILQVVCIFNNNIWFDESYTVGLVNHNIIDLIKIAIADVHPVLYYILLRIFSIIFGNSIIILKLFSIIPIVLLAIFGYKSIGKEFGHKIAMLFILILETLPMTLHYAVQIRMHSLAMLFVSISAFYAYKALKYLNWKDFVIFCICSILSSYTHHFGFFACLTIDLFMLIYILIKNKDLLKKYVISVITQFILFIPGLLIFLKQAFSVSHGFWIEVKYPQIFFEMIEYLFKDNIQSIIPFVFGLTFVLYVIYKLITYKDKKDLSYKLSIISFGLITFVIVVSLCISSYRAIFIPRYMLPMLGIIVFGVTCLISLEKNKYILSILFTMIVTLNIWNYITFFNINYDVQNLEIQKLEDVRKDDIFVYKNIGVGGIIDIYYNNNAQYFFNENGWKIHTAYKAFGSQMKVVDSIEQIVGSRIWVIDSNSNSMYDDIKKRNDMKEVITKKEIYHPYSGSIFIVSLF
ncbi:MAG: glycosyltransferase family 39 protein, partial [Clostridia bacterium]